MKDMNKLAKRGWWKAMIHQRTLSLILTLDNFLLSGPHILLDNKRPQALGDPNVFVIKSKTSPLSTIESELDKLENLNPMSHTQTYYIMRPFIRGILFGLNPLYQISLFVPCNDPKQINLYREIIEKIDIGGQFFQDRIYWNLESLQRDIMDDRLACLIYSDNNSINNNNNNCANKINRSVSNCPNTTHNEWIQKIGIEARPYSATIENDSGIINNNLFDLVEMRTFLEEMHQRFFSLINENQKIHFVNMIRQHLSETGGGGGCGENKSLKESMWKPANGFYSVNNGIGAPRNELKKPFVIDRYSLTEKENKVKSKFNLFRNPTSTVSGEIWKDNNTKLLINEYEDIILEQLRINYEMSRIDVDHELFSRSLRRWNSITLRKSEILGILLNQNEGKLIREKLGKFHAIYYQKKYQESPSPDSEIYRSTVSRDSTSASETSDSSCYIVISGEHTDSKKPETTDFSNTFFTTWYVTLENR